MSGSTRRSSPTAAYSYYGQEEEYEDSCTHNTEEETRKADPVVSNSQSAAPPHRTVFGVLEGSSEQFPAYNDPLQLASPSLATFPSAGLSMPYHSPALDASTLAQLRHRMSAKRPTFFDTRQFSSLPPLQRLEQTNVSLKAALAILGPSASALLLQFPNPITPTSLLGNDRQLSRANQLQHGMPSKWSGGNGASIIPAISANTPNRWPSAGLVGDTNAFSRLLVPPRPRPTNPTLPAGVSSTNALAMAVSLGDIARPFSMEEECLIPIVGGAESFPMVLHRALAELELIGVGREIATFLPDGRSFYIKDQALFEKEVLPLFFPNMKNFNSFQRQLNLYDFRRTKGATFYRGAYSHDLFIRDNPAMSSRMRRTRIKGPKAVLLKGR
jgi:hypothetical protein